MLKSHKEGPKDPKTLLSHQKNWWNTPLGAYLYLDIGMLSEYFDNGPFLHRNSPKFDNYFLGILTHMWNCS